MAVEIEDKDEGRAEGCDGCDGDGGKTEPSGIVQDGGFPRPRNWTSVWMRHGADVKELLLLWQGLRP